MAKKPEFGSKGVPVGGRPSTLVDTAVMYCADNLDRWKKLHDECVTTDGPRSHWKGKS